MSVAGHAPPDNVALSLLMPECVCVCVGVGVGGVHVCIQEGMEWNSVFSERCVWLCRGYVCVCV